MHGSKLSSLKVLVFPAILALLAIMAQICWPPDKALQNKGAIRQNQAAPPASPVEYKDTPPQKSPHKFIAQRSESVTRNP